MNYDDDGRNRIGYDAQDFDGMPCKFCGHPRCFVKHKLLDDCRGCHGATCLTLEEFNATAESDDQRIEP